MSRKQKAPLTTTEGKATAGIIQSTFDFAHLMNSKLKYRMQILI